MPYPLCVGLNLGMLRACNPKQGSPCPDTAVNRPGLQLLLAYLWHDCCQHRLQLHVELQALHSCKRGSSPVWRGLCVCCARGCAGQQQGEGGLHATLLRYHNVHV